LSANFDDRGVGVVSVRQDNIESSPRPSLFKPVFTLRIVQVLRLVFEIVSVVPVYDARGWAAEIPLETKRPLLCVESLNVRRIWRAVDPTELRPYYGAHVEVFGTGDVFRVYPHRQGSVAALSF
jgi:hypothetical protein